MVDHDLKSGSEPCHVVMPSIPALRMLRQEGVLQKLEASLDCIVKPQNKPRCVGRVGVGRLFLQSFRKVFIPCREQISSHC